MLLASETPGSVTQPAQGAEPCPCPTDPPGVVGAVGRVYVYGYGHAYGYGCTHRGGVHLTVDGLAGRQLTAKV